MKKLSTLSIGIIGGIILAASLTVSAASVFFPYQGGTGTGVVPTQGQILVGQSNGTYLPVATSTLGIGGGNPGGFDTNVQFNNAGTFGGVGGFQFDQSGRSLFVSNTFASGTNAVSNGTFTGGCSSWTLQAGWTCASNAVSKTSDGTGLLVSSSPGPAERAPYLIQFTLRDFTAGSVTVNFGGTATVYSANATTSQRIFTVGAGQFIFSPSNTARVTIDDVSAYRIAGGTINTGGNIYSGGNIYAPLGAGTFGGAITSSSSISASNDIYIGNSLRALSSSGITHRNSSATELFSAGNTGNFGGINSVSFGTSAVVSFRGLTASVVPLIGTNKELTSDSLFVYKTATRRLGVGEADPIATGHFNSITGTGINTTNTPTVTRLTATDLADPTGTASSIVTTFDSPSAGSATQNFGGTGYFDDASTWDFEYWAYDSSFRYTQAGPGFTTGQVVEGGTMADYAIDHSWTAPAGGDFAPTGYAIHRTTDDVWWDVGNVISITDDNTSFTPGSPLAGSRNDLNADGTVYNFDIYQAGVSPSGGAYYSPNGENHTFTDNNDGSYFTINHTGTGLLKVTNGTNGKTFTTSFSQDANVLPESPTVTPSTYGFSPNSDSTYFRIITRNVVLGTTIYGSSGTNSQSNDDTDPYYWSLSWNNVGSDNYTVAISPDGSVWNQSLNAGTNTSIFYDNLSSAGGTPTESPTSVIFPAGLFSRATTGFSDQPVLIIRSTDGSTPSPYIDFTNGSDTSLGKFGFDGDGKFKSNVDFNVPDEAYGVAWDTSLEVPTKNALYDKIQTLLSSANISDVAYGPSWNGNSTTSPSRNAVYDKIESMVASVSNSDNSLTISPTTGAVIASLNIANPNVWTGFQTFLANGLGTTATSTRGILLANNTTTSFSSQVSPPVVWKGFHDDGISAATKEMRMYVRGGSTSSLDLDYSNASGAFSNIFRISQAGSVTVGSWQATAVAAGFGGTGISTASATGIPQIVGGVWSVPTTLRQFDGNLGVGTSTPQARLVVVGASASSTPVLTVASSTGANLFSIGAGGHVITGGGTPAVSSCGTTPSINGNDTTGSVTVGTGVVVSCTITFARPRLNTPRVVGVVTGGGLNITGGYSAKSTTAVTFSFAATVGSGTFDYFIIE